MIFKVMRYGAKEQCAAFGKEIFASLFKSLSSTEGRTFDIVGFVQGVALLSLRRKRDARLFRV
jgi:hypothetical protein